MIYLRRVGMLWAILTLLTVSFSAQKVLTATEVKNHAGGTATVCDGVVVSRQYASSTKGQPTFLNLDKPYRIRSSRLLIWGENRGKFGTPESEYKGKRICVTGKINEYKGKPEITASERQQMRLD